MRFSIKNIKQEHGDFFTPSKMVMLICFYLYEQDISLGHIIELYQQHRYSALCLPIYKGKQAANNSFQEKLNSIAPRTKKLRLYIKTWGLDIPLYYIIVHRNPDTNLFELKADRIYKIKSYPTGVRDGIIINWPNQIPDVACGQEPILSRIVGGGEGISNLIQEIITLPEVQRELSLAITTAQLFTSNNEFSVWASQGKIVIKPVSLSYPYEYYFVRSRAYAKSITKPKCILWATADVELSVSVTPYYILPQIKNAAEFHSDVPEIERFLINTLDTRLLPFVAVVKEDSAKIYALTYNPDQKNAYVTFLGNKTARYCNHIPSITLLDLPYTDDYISYQYRFVPNKALADFIYTEMFHGNIGNTQAHNERLKALMQVVKPMGYTQKEHLPIAFKNWNIELSEEELQQLA